MSIAMSDICENCGKTYGRHIGDNCPGGQTTFKRLKNKLSQIHDMLEKSLILLENRVSPIINFDGEDLNEAKRLIYKATSASNLLLMKEINFEDFDEKLRGWISENYGKIVKWKDVPHEVWHSISIELFKKLNELKLGE
jgi:hypothetical protein